MILVYPWHEHIRLSHLEETSMTTEPGVNVISNESRVTSKSPSKSVSSENIPGVILIFGRNTCRITRTLEEINSRMKTRSNFEIAEKKCK